MPLKIDRDLNLVIPIDRENEKSTLHVHSTPISREAFRRYAIVMGRVYGQLSGNPDLGVNSGPRLAAILLEEVAKAEGRWEGPEGVEQGLFAEIRRLTMVICPTPQGWQPVMFDEALNRGALSVDESEEAFGLITFFTVIWRVAPLKNRVVITQAAAFRYGGQSTVLNSTEYAHSLPTLTETGPSIMRVA